MDTMDKMRHCSKDIGAVTILVAGVMIFFILLFLVVGVNFVYVYYVRGELQNAADAGALAGAALINDQNDLCQNPARAEAKKFAFKNKATEKKEPVDILTQACDNNLSDANDITVGNWNPTRPINDRYHRGETPINAIEVRPRRTTNSPGGPVDFIFKNIISSMTNMGVTRVAIAARPESPTTGLAMCVDACPEDHPPLDLSQPFLFSVPSNSPANPYGLAWTELNTDSNIEGQSCLKNTSKCDSGFEDGCTTNDAMMVASYIWQKRIPQTKCFSIRWSNGQKTARFDLYCAFQSMTFDALNKTDTSGNTPPKVGSVDKWKIIVPIINPCPSGAQPGGGPYPIERYAEIVIDDVTDKFGQPAPPVEGIKISSIRCVPCGDWTIMGKVPVLVQ